MSANASKRGRAIRRAGRRFVVNKKRYRGPGRSGMASGFHPDKASSILAVRSNTVR